MAGNITPLDVYNKLIELEKKLEELKEEIKKQKKEEEEIEIE